MVRRIVERPDLSAREIAMLQALHERKVVSTKQMARLADRFNPPISPRTTHRLLARLMRLKLVKTKDFIVSCKEYGYREKIWRISKAGIGRVILDENESFRARKFWRDAFPSQTIPHILAVNDVENELGVAVEHEPKCHRKFSRTNQYFVTEDMTLKPDLFAEIDGRWRFFEIDMGSERANRIVKKCELYISYFNKMADSWKPNLPKAIWVVRNDARKALLTKRIRERLPRHWHLFPCALLSEIRGSL